MRPRRRVQLRIKYVHRCEFAKLYAGLAHTLRVLYLDASSAKYAGSQDKKRMLDQLCSGIASLSIEQCIRLLKV